MIKKGIIMKKTVYNILMMLALAVMAVGCSKETELLPESQIVDSATPQNEFDEWLMSNYIETYNIDLKYRMEDILSDYDYNLAPADVDQSILMTKMISHLIFQAYDEVTGSRDFIRGYFPKIIQLIGSPAYNDNGTIVLGSAEGGKMMTLYMINNIENLFNAKDPALLNQYYFNTLHHEFAHILHQTKPYSVEFNQITPSAYIGDAWSETNDSAARLEGFITAYSMKDPNEDFVELVSHYVTHSAEEWDALLAQGGTSGRAIIEQKTAIMVSYMSDSWGIDMDVLRGVVLRRQNEVWDLTMDLQ